jgi:signal transduction histidine kinase
MLMPETGYLLAVLAALIVVVLASWAAWHRNTRATLAETRSELASARSEITRLTEQLRQVPAPVENVREVERYTGGRHVEIFVNLSRRLQSLVHREIQLLDGLENEVEDPDLLKGLFQVDHLATRIRRHAENLAVLGGSVSRRQWSRPVALTEVLRSAIAEVEHYSRVKLVPPIEGTVPGHAVASVIHLVAELIENATMFAPPHTQVLLRVQHVTAGVAIEVEDRGLGMQRTDLDRVNQLLLDSGSTDLDELLRDGRIGLYVVSVIARQHGIVVQLQPNIFGGIQAVTVLPRLLLGSASEPEPEAPRPQSLTASREPLRSQERLPLQKRVPLQHRFTISEPPPVVPEDTTEILPQPVLRASRPPLPRRRSQTHMAPQLQIGPPRTATDPSPEHDPGLMASFMNGVSQGEAGSPAPGSHG